MRGPADRTEQGRKALARRGARVAAEARRETQERRDRRAAKMRAAGASEAMVRQVLSPADENIAALARITRRDRLNLTSAPRRQSCGAQRHRRASGARPMRQRGSRRSSSASRGDPDPGESDSDEPASRGGRSPHVLTRPRASRARALWLGSADHIEHVASVVGAR